MSLSKIEALEGRWQTTGVLRGVERALDRIGFTEGYVERSTSRPRSQKNKVIKDGVWGMIEVDSSSIRLFDSPILQRLRSIKQLGLTYLTYPSAEHSRFIHSLGMYGVVSRFIDVVNRNPTNSRTPEAPFGVWNLSNIHSRILRHAAILHDIGHLPFSHVTERIFQSDSGHFSCGGTSVEEFMLEAQDCLGKLPKFADCLSLAIVLTNRFRRFYCNWVEPSAEESDCRMIAALIIGLPPEPGLYGLANVISGDAIDGDKIDYIRRDAEACGIPVGVDLSRLFLRSSFLEVTPTELQRLRSLAGVPEMGEIIFAVNSSGIDSIEEVGQARTSLYHRVYLHQTTRNAERVLSKAVYFASNIGSCPNNFLDTLHTWSMNDVSFLENLMVHSDPAVSEFADRIRSRNLPKRALAYSRNLCKLIFPINSVFPKMPKLEGKRLSMQFLGSGIEALRDKRLNGDSIRNLEDEILSETQKLAILLRSSSEVENFSALPSFVNILPMPNIETNRSPCIVLQNGQLVSSAASSVSDEQMEAADIMKSAGYVMCDEEWRELTFIAARTVLYARKEKLSDISFVPHKDVVRTIKSEGRIFLDVDAVIRRVGLSKEKVYRFMRNAGQLGYFDRFPRLAPLAIDGAEIDKLTHLFSPFSGQCGWSVSANSIRSFIAQFPDKLRCDIVKVLSSATVLDRSKLVELISLAISRVENTASRKFITGFSPDSGNHVRTQIEHELSLKLKSDRWEFKKTIRDVLSDAVPGDTLVFLDDNVTSGSQAICQFYAWLEVDESKWSVEQKGERGIERVALSQRDKKALCDMNLSIVSALGTAVAADRLNSELQEIGVNNFRGLFFGEEMQLETALPNDLRDYLQEVGASALAWARHDAISLSEISSELTGSCLADALGYRGASSMVFTTLNVPVGTLTAMWCPGFYKGEPWFPLFIRRGYIDKLIIA